MRKTNKVRNTESETRAQLIEIKKEIWKTAREYVNRELAEKQAAENSRYLKFIDGLSGYSPWFLDSLREAVSGLDLFVCREIREAMMNGCTIDADKIQKHYFDQSRSYNTSKISIWSRWTSVDQALAGKKIKSNKPIRSSWQAVQQIMVEKNMEENEAVNKRALQIAAERGIKMSPLK